VVNIECLTTHDFDKELAERFVARGSEIVSSSEAGRQSFHSVAAPLPSASEIDQEWPYCLLEPEEHRYKNTH